MDSNIVKTKVRNPNNNKLANRIKTEDSDGNIDVWRWNTVWNVYNSVRNYEQFTENKLVSIVWDSE